MANPNGHRGRFIEETLARRGFGYPGTIRRMEPEFEEVFISDGQHEVASNSNSMDPIQLDFPRPDSTRARNLYIDVTKNKNSIRRHQIRRPIGNSTTHRIRNCVERDQTRSVSTVVSRQPGSCAPDRPKFSEIQSCAPDRPRLPISSNLSDKIRPKLFVQSSEVQSCDKIRPWHAGLIGCQPSTSFPVDHTPRPGGAVRLSNSNSIRSDDRIRLPVPVISSQPRSSFGLIKNDRKRLDKSDSIPSLMCTVCGGCRCKTHSTPPTLPSRWICNDSCLLSKDSIVDAVSCMCCVKGCWYHVGLDCEDDRYLAEDSMEFSKAESSSALHFDSKLVSKNCILRWIVLASAALCLPCIWCYFPIKACACGVESAYARYHDIGCRCDRNRKRRQAHPTSRRGRSSSNSRSDRNLSRRFRRKRSRTLPPELPSIAAAKAANRGGKNGTVECSGSSKCSIMEGGV